MSEPHRLSYSQLQSWATCGEAYRLERVIGVPQRPGWALIGGSTVHKLTEEHDFRLLGVDMPERSWDTVFEEYTVEAEEKHGISRDDFKASGRSSAKWPNKENPDWWRSEGPSMVARWVNFRRTAPWDVWITPEGEPAIELQFELDLLDGDVIVRGAIDRVMVADGFLVVVDVKSGSRPQPTPRQLGGYKVALEERYPGVDIRYGAFWDARSGSTSAPAALGRFTRERLEYQYGALRHAREVGLYLPSPSALCGSCSVNAFCSEYGGERYHEVPAAWEEQVPFDAGVDVPKDGAA